MAYRPTEKTQARKAELRQRLLNAALELVSGGGFGALTMVGVASKAGIATGAVYKHFESKAHLCAEVFRVATEKEVAVVRDTALGAGSAAERLQHAIGAFAERALRNPRLAYALIAEPVPRVSAAALVGVIAESLTGPLSPQHAQEPLSGGPLIAAIQAFCLRAVAQPAPTRTAT